MSNAIQALIKEHVDYQAFNDLQQQSNTLANTIADILQSCVNDNGRASLAVSGGSTPKVLFKLLSQISIDWAKVTISLVDDRWLAPTHVDSNQKLVTDNLLKNKAAAANFVGLYQADTQLIDTIELLNTTDQNQYLPFDVLLLGMGNDGHCASIFPCSEQVGFGLSTTNTYLMSVPTTAPYERITLSAHTISSAKHLFLQLKGDDKQQTLHQAITGKDEKNMPIRRFLNKNLTVLWCP